MSASVEFLGAASSMPAVRVQDVWASLAPRWGTATLLSRARGRKAQALVQTESEDRIKEGGFKLAGQAMKPLPVSMVALRPGRGVTRQVAHPLVPQGCIQLPPAFAISR